MPTSYNTIVVGMGAAGATAASLLARAGLRVLGLEAGDRVGGRVLTVPFGEGVVELGAEWIHGEQNSKVFEAAVQNSVKLKSQEMDFSMFRSDGRKLNEELQSLIFELIDKMFEILDSRPLEYTSLGNHVIDGLKAYLKQRKPEIFQDKDLMKQLLQFLQLLNNNYQACEDWHDVSAWCNFQELEGDQHLSWHKHGYKTFFDILLNKHNNGPGLRMLEIQLNKEVTEVAWPQHPSQQVTVTCKDGSVYSAHAAIITVSLGVLKERHSTLFTPKLPEEKIEAIEQLPMGVMDKVMLSFDEAWWPQDVTWLGFLWKGEDLAKVDIDDYWTTRIFAVSHPLGSSNVLTLWTSGEVAKLVETLPEDLVRRKCVELLRKFLGATFTIPEPTGIIRSKWFSNPLTRGSYSYDGMNGDMSKLRTVLGAPLTDSAGHPRLLFAGEATNLKHFSTVHGASETGHREAMRLLSIASKI